MAIKIVTLSHQHSDGICLGKRHYSKAYTVTMFEPDIPGCYF